MEQENRKEELKRRLEGLLNEYAEEAIPLSRTEKKLLENGSEEDIKLVERYNRSKFRRS